MSELRGTSSVSSLRHILTLPTYYYMGSDLYPFTKTHKTSEECDLIDFYGQEKLVYNFVHFFEEGFR